MPTPPQRPPQLLRELIKVYDQALPLDLCAEIVERFDAASDQAVRRDAPGKRSFDELDIHDSPAWRDVMERLIPVQDEYVNRYMRESMGYFSDGLITENIRIKRYDPVKKDEFANHVDVYDWVTARRVLVLFYYLNDVEKGGETDFPGLRVRVRAQAGRLVMFPPYWMYLHAGLKPVSGPKYLIGTYVTFDR